jgi:hypothetical protein
MEDDEYVETSDVEELADSYAARMGHDLTEVDLDAEEDLMHRIHLTPQSSPSSYKTPRKRRKVRVLLFIYYL